MPLEQWYNHVPHIISILGTDWSVELTTPPDQDLLEGDAGATNQYTKTILLNRDELDNNAYIKETVRHEILHAFLMESGLDTCANEVDCWARNEEMIDWFAIQFPKISQIYKQLKVM